MDASHLNEPTRVGELAVLDSSSKPQLVATLLPAGPAEPAPSSATCSVRKAGGLRKLVSRDPI
jgi:hypothetical protein